jgi:hypothetical protein
MTPPAVLVLAHFPAWLLLRRDCDGFERSMPPGHTASVLDAMRDIGHVQYSGCPAHSRRLSRVMITTMHTIVSMLPPEVRIVALAPGIWTTRLAGFDNGLAERSQG